AHDPAHATQIARTLLDVSGHQPTAPAAGALLAALREGRGEPPPTLRALGATAAPEVLVPLLERLPSDEVRIRMAVLEALRRYFEHAPPDGRAADPLLAILGDVTEPERQPVVSLLGRVGAARALPALRTLLSHSDAELRLAAVRAIGAIGDPEGGPALLALLDDPDARLRYEAARAVGAAASDETVAELLERLRDREPTDRHALLIALGEAVPRLAANGALADETARRALDAMLALAEGEDRGLAARALDVLSAWRPAGAADALVRALDRAGPERSLAIVRALGERDEPSARAALRAQLAEASVSLATQAASVLGERGGPEDGALLLARAPRLPWPASAAAAFALARLARRGQLDGSAHEGLCRLAASHDPFVRANVAVAMAAVAAPPCPNGPGPLAWLERGHASVVRIAAARWARASAGAGHLPAAAVDAALAACAVEPLSPEVNEVCARPELPPLDASADVYAYAPDGTRLWADRLVALRLADGSVWITRSDANGHLRLSGVPRGPLRLEDPAATPLEP
ncbi:MAG TPA: HEAT repeat domain-containing protein, partial [Sandaracinaceae bacterium]